MWLRYSNMQFLGCHSVQASRTSYLSHLCGPEIRTDVFNHLQKFLLTHYFIRFTYRKVWIFGLSRSVINSYLHFLGFIFLILPKCTSKILAILIRFKKVIREKTGKSIGKSIASRCNLGEALYISSKRKIHILYFGLLTINLFLNICWFSRRLSEVKKYFAS